MKNIYKSLDKDRHVAISQMYASGKYTTEKLASIYDVTPRTIQRIAAKYGVLRTQAEANKMMAPLKSYHRIPPELKAQRKQLRNWVRLELIQNHPYCSTCGGTVEDGVRLEVDHIDEDATNNEESNLQVLCGLCNRGKSRLARYGGSVGGAGTRSV